MFSTATVTRCYSDLNSTWPNWPMGWASQEGPGPGINVLWHRYYFNRLGSGVSARCTFYFWHPRFAAPSVHGFALDGPWFDSVTLEVLYGFYHRFEPQATWVEESGPIYIYAEAPQLLTYAEAPPVIRQMVLVGPDYWLVWKPLERYSAMSSWGI
jgi:hypothetical protein